MENNYYLEQVYINMHVEVKKKRLKACKQGGNYTEQSYK
jgi:hypothetical protein